MRVWRVSEICSRSNHCPPIRGSPPVGKGRSPNLPISLFLCHVPKCATPADQSSLLGWMTERVSKMELDRFGIFFFRKRTNLNRFKDDIDNGNDDDCQDELRGIIALFIYPVAEITSPIPRMVRPKSAQIIDSVESGERRRVEQERQCVETKERKELMKPVYFCWFHACFILMVIIIFQKIYVCVRWWRERGIRKERANEARADKRFTVLCKPLLSKKDPIKNANVASISKSD